MLFYLLLLFTLVPLIELTLLIWIAQQTGPWFTLLLVILTGVVGAWLARRQGLRCWLEVHRQMARGELPTDSLLDGLMILLAGVVLITPGVLTDLVGFALLVPPVRGLIRRHVAARIKARMVVHHASGYEGPPAEDDDVIDVEYHRTDDTEA